MHSIGPAIGVPGDSDMLPSGHYQSSNVVMGAISSTHPIATHGHTLVSSLTGARPLDRAASIATSFGGKSRAPPPYAV